MLVLVDVVDYGCLSMVAICQHMPNDGYLKSSVSLKDTSRLYHHCVLTV